ncbi:MAG TPA: type II toxin-antitoxin system VapC family toxin [Usitatibacter sp.]|nr:type II toxin-antitoxin system VapC family toxin [Usitatibacter sp.]
MKFWDASALVPLLIEQPSRERLLLLLEDDPAVAAWWGTPVECTSAIARCEREGLLSMRDATLAAERLHALARTWLEITPSPALRDTAQRLLRVHPLRAADSLQLAAAIVAADADPRSLPFVCLDERLAEAASREGFPTIPS